ncbi:hypothetical protein SAMN05421594_3103 [Chryseobacterium oleae]|uniref:F5/8 type C domain-containing protein n=1 Tax=Chryseobacterium oleae TaxID=491207 RepID=A0A1I4ZMT6_CHROL|nr:hypothetical protein [Chryseobacterium oleae]SFN51532.1 hypothetical protein SAMN05421594_3103 [Chryseobacterium oleae]
MIKEQFLIVLFFLFFGKHSSQNINLALGKTVTSSSIENPIYPNSNLTDGNFITSAKTASALSPPNAEWFLIDLGTDYFIQNITLGTVVPDNGLSRRFMIITYPGNLQNLGNNPRTYISATNISPQYNRFIYTSRPPSFDFGETATNPNIPGNAGQNLGPVFVNGIFNVNLGIHRARFILILNLQDTSLEFTECQVAPGPVAVRTFINNGFEQGSTFNNSSLIPEGSVPGWSTTEAVNSNETTFSLGGNIEFWKSGFLGVQAYQGNYFIELNAYSNSKLERYPICILPNEVFNWSLAHRGRNGTDVMRLVIDDIDVAEFTDSNSQTGTHTKTILPGGTESSLTIANDPTTTTGWTRYYGTWKNTTGISKQITFGFRAVSSAGGSISAGNFLDDVRISGLTAIMSLDKSNKNGSENIASANLPKILINGILTVPRTIQVSIIGGTSVRGIDYTTTPASGPLSITIPAGNYDGTEATAVSMASVLQIVQDFTAEGDETIILKLENPGTDDFQTADNSSCQGAVLTSTYTITDPVCYKNPLTTGIALPTQMGITAFNRAGNSTSNWPKIRTGGYLVLESSTKGMVITRTVKENITNPVIGMIIYETNDNCISIYTSSGWRCYRSLACPD